MSLRVYTALHRHMLNKEIFMKRNIDPPPSFLRVDKDCLIYSFHRDFTITVCHKTSSTFMLRLLTLCSLSVSVFYPSDIRLCGTDTWVSSRAVSSKCITTEMFWLALLFPFPQTSPVLFLALCFVLFLICFFNFKNSAFKFHFLFLVYLSAPLV